RGGVVPGRAAEPGRVVPDPPPPAGTAEPQAGAAVFRPCAGSGPGGGHPPAPHDPADGPGLRRDQGESQGRVEPFDLASARHSQQEEFMTIEVRVPQLPESVADATLVAWHKKPGDAVNRDENLVDLETDKVVLEVPAPAAGVIRELKVQNGATVKSGELLAILEEGPASPARAGSAGQAPAAGAKEGSKESGKPAAAGSAQKLSPSARRMVEENNIDPSQVAPSGKDGRVTKTDVITHMDRKSSSSTAPARSEGQGEGAPAARGARTEQRVPMTRLRARIAERMVQAQSTQAL